MIIDHTHCLHKRIAGGWTDKFETIFFKRFLKHKIQATHHVGVIGIGGLGHIAIKLLKAWGCEITAFSSNPDKTEELKAMGADHVVNSRETTDENGELVLFCKVCLKHNTVACLT